MDEAELARRRPVWSALSDVFLDTETRGWFPRIALTLLDSGYDEATLERIWRFEIFPECRSNLDSIAGEWAALALDEPALIRRAVREPTVGNRIHYRLRAGALDAEWRGILQLMRTLATLPPETRSTKVKVWSALAELYLEEHLGATTRHDGKRVFFRDLGGSHEQVLATFEREFRPVYRTLLVRGEVDAQRAADVREFLQDSF